MAPTEAIVLSQTQVLNPALEVEPKMQNPAGARELVRSVSLMVCGYYNGSMSARAHPVVSWQWYTQVRECRGVSIRWWSAEVSLFAPSRLPWCSMKNSLKFTRRMNKAICPIFRMNTIFSILLHGRTLTYTKKNPAGYLKILFQYKNCNNIRYMICHSYRWDFLECLHLKSPVTES